MSKATKATKKPARKAKKQSARASQRRRDRSLAIAPPRRRPPRQRATAFAGEPSRQSKTRRTSIVIRLAQLPHAAGLPLPAYQTAGAAGIDLVAALPARKPLKLALRARAIVPTGIIMEMPVGWEAQVRPRSGLALKHGITVLNSPGTIDSDYRGEVQVILVNLGKKPFKIERGERIAQMVITPAPRVRFAAVTAVELSPSSRGTGGFGSTGTRSRSTVKSPPRKKTKSGVKRAQVAQTVSSRRGR